LACGCRCYGSEHRKAREGARFSPLHGAPGAEDGDEEEVMKKIDDGELLDLAALR
jgi:hypothetical protein